jgi:hypothetical protein
MTDRVVIEPLIDGDVVVTIRGCRIALVIPWWAVVSRPNRYVIVEDD